MKKYRRSISVLLVWCMLISLLPTTVLAAEVTGITLDQTSLTLDVGEQVKLIATISPEDASEDVASWYSYDESIATVADGLVTGIAVGETTVKVIAADGKFEAVCQVTVTASDSNDLNGDGYHDGDVAVINGLIENNDLDWTKDDPASWPVHEFPDRGVEWNFDSAKRIIGLDVSGTALTGEASFSGLTELRSLVCEDTGITGLELAGLTNLTILYCGNTSITELEVANLSNLQEIQCFNTGVEELDVAGLTNLISLSCSDTDITELDISGLINLKTLWCANTGIKELDVAGLTNLTSLLCFGTDITELDVSTLTNLQTLWCENTGIQVLDVARLINLESLDCSDTNITELDVANLTNLVGLTCDNINIKELEVDNLRNLSSLSCSRTGITELNVSNLVNLDMLWCNGTGISELDVSQLNNLVTLYGDEAPLLTITVPAGYGVGSDIVGNGTLNYALPTPARNGYTFTGWYTAEVDGELVQVGDSFDTATILYSGWADNGGADADDLNGDGYHDGDVAVINGLIEHNGLDWIQDDIAGWTYVTWNHESPKRISQLDVGGTTLFGTLDATALAKLTVLWCNNTDITSLDVSKNTMLTELVCSDTGLTGLDVSNNLELTWLSCYNTNITELDVSYNTALTNLSCFSTGITSLDVSKNPVLTELICSDTGLTTLDLSQNPALTELVCSNTGITSLDVSGNPALTCLVCDNTNLTSLDVSKNTVLTRLDCYGTKITELNVSKNAMLTELYCYDTDISALDLSGNTALEQLVCRNTGITSLDVSNNPALTRLECGETEITSLDVSGNPALMWLICDDTDLALLDVSKNTELIWLDCAYTGITELDLSQNTALTDLYCDNTPLLTITVPAGYTAGSLGSENGTLNYALPTPVRGTDTFVGWFTSPTGGRQVNVGDSFAEVTTLYSQWIPANEPNRMELEAVKAAIEAYDWTVAQATVNDTETVKAWIEQQLSAMELNGAAFTVTVNTVVPAEAGKLSDLDGTNGSFSFEVKLGKGSDATYAETTVSITNGVITATVYVPAKYTVTYDANGGIGGVPAAEIVTEGETYIVAAQGTLIREGYEFTGWNTKADGSGTGYNPGARLTASRAIILYAQWVEVKNPAADNIAALEILKQTLKTHDWTVAQATANDAKTVKTWIEQQLDAMELNGAAFTVTVNTVIPAEAGKLSDLDGTSGSFSFEVKLGKGSDATYAETVVSITGGVITATVYVPVAYTVTYNANGGTGAVPAAVKETEGTVITVAGQGGLTNGAYEFVGWNTAANGTGIAYQPDSQLTIKADTTLYAQWRISNRTVSGTITGHKGVVYQGVTAKLVSTDGTTYIGSVSDGVSDGKKTEYTYRVHAPEGKYNLIVVATTSEGVEVTRTHTVNLKNKDATQQVNLPNGQAKAKSEVVVEQDAPQVLAGGLDDIIDQTIAETENVAAVDVIMVVEAVDETTSEAQEIRNQSTGQELVFVELTIRQDVTLKSGETESKKLADLNSMVELVISFDGKGKKDVKVYRYHGDQVETLTTTPNANGEWIELDEDHIVIHAKKFSTYAIGYSEAVSEPETPPSADGSGSTGGGSSGGGLSSTTTTTKPDGSIVTVKTSKDGTVTTKIVAPDGSKSETIQDKNGVQRSAVTVSDQAVAEATAAGKAILLPLVPVAATDNAEKTVAVTVNLPGSTKSAKVEIPVENVRAGTVAVIVYPDGTEKVVAATIPTETGVTLPIEDGATVKIVDKSRDFGDVAANHVFKEAIDFASARGIVEGYANGGFSPAGLATSNAVVTVVSRIMGNDFYGEGATDKANVWAADLGISAGLDMSGNITRGSFMTMLWRAAGSPEVSADNMAFTDANSLDTVEQAAFAWAVENDIIGGYADGSVRPDAGITRGAMAAIAQRYMTK